MNITNIYADGVVIILFSELIRPLTTGDESKLRSLATPLTLDQINQMQIFNVTYISGLGDGVK
jgi:hypothetical protein